ncbi:MAG: glycosyl transferase family 2 [Acidiferrobacteraceae bacterium]|jgi:glycosyltransferase involved in cell wall biosynthesis|nr:glycosyl transferase family 2 [Acidiferrobacteraceae bacterium]|tara:strand:- start:5474 stop:6226 length:753 start_codon:yes stop_codon:yes gene_type:complete
MIGEQKVVVIMPAYNASKTLAATYAEIPFDIVDEVVLVDDCSSDKTPEVARQLGIQHIIEHPKNIGYGGNQKTCYKKALDLGADIVVMVHPDYQYTPKLIPAMSFLIAQELYQVVLGSRILGKGALRGGMPLYKFFFNRLLTAFENVMVGAKLSEYHTGYRAFSRKVLEEINFASNSDDFIFDNQMLSQVIFAGYEIGEITCPTKYFGDASSINFRRSVKYGFGVILTSWMHFFQRIGLANFKMYRHPRN